MQPPQGHLDQSRHPVTLISGATGYLGSALATALLRRGHAVRALVRPGSLQRAPPGAELFPGDPLDPGAVMAAAEGCATLCHLVGTPRPAPWKQRQFERIDRASLFASVLAASTTAIRHFVYVSVAHPAPIMRGYIAIRLQCEDRIAASGIPASILRPWYVLGPGHRWPALLLPLYRLAEAFPAARDSALRLGLLHHSEMIAALVRTIENPPDGRRVLNVPAIRILASTAD